MVCNIYLISIHHHLFAHGTPHSILIILPIIVVIITAFFFLVLFSSPVLFGGILSSSSPSDIYSPRALVCVCWRGLLDVFRVLRNQIFIIFLFALVFVKDCVDARVRERRKQL